MIAMFLNLIYLIVSPKRGSIVRLPPGAATIFLLELLDICQRFDCPDLVALVYRELGHQAEKGPIGLLLRLASERNDLSLAKVAIKHHRPHFALASERVNNFWGVVDLLREDWRLAFVRCLLPASNGRTPGGLALPGGLAYATDWAAAAEAFAPGNTSDKVSQFTQYLTQARADQAYSRF